MHVMSSLRDDKHESSNKRESNQTMIDIAWLMFDLFICGKNVED